MITAEEFFRQKIQEGNPIQSVVTLSGVLITAEQGMRWSKEYSDYVAKTNFNKGQETLEEAFEKWAEQFPKGYEKLDVLRFGAKWQQENSNENALDFEIDALKREIKLLKHQINK